MKQNKRSIKAEDATSALVICKEFFNVLNTTHDRQMTFLYPLLLNSFIVGDNKKKDSAPWLIEHRIVLEMFFPFECEAVEIIKIKSILS